MYEILLITPLAFLLLVFLFAQWITHRHKHIFDKESRIPKKYSQAVQFVDDLRDRWHYIVDPKKNVNTLKAMIKRGDVPMNGEWQSDCIS